MKLAVPLDARRPLSGERSVSLGPFYDPGQGKMLGGVINTFSTMAFAETAFGLQRVEKRIGSIEILNERSVGNRCAIDEWVSRNPLFEFGVRDRERRGAAVTLLKVNDPGIEDRALHERIVAGSKQLLGYEGLTHPDGRREPGLDVARYVNAFPGTPGDYRAWIGGIRPVEDVLALLENLKYAYHRARIVVIEEELAKAGIGIVSEPTGAGLDLVGAPVDAAVLADARSAAETMAAILGALDATTDPGRRQELIARHAGELAKASGRCASLMGKLDWAG